MDKTRIAARFSAAAPTYDRAAEVQRRMAERLTSILPPAEQLAVVAADLIHDAPGGAPIYELGCGTGILTHRLLDRYPALFVHALDLAPGMIEVCRRRFASSDRAAFLVADAETYTPSGPAALVVSNCAFQWFADPQATLARLRHCLAPGGWLAVGTLLEGSLAELDACHRAVMGRPAPTLPLWDELSWRAALALAGLNPLPVSRVEDLVVLYNDPLEVMRSLKEIGASLTGDDGRRPLSADQVRRLTRRYREDYADPQSDRVRTTSRAFFILAQAK